MKLNQLRDFVAVAESGSLRAAARSLDLAQPAITRSIQELERSLGAQLFHRSARGVTLTPIGRTFFDRANGILNDVRRSKEEISQLQGAVEGELVLGLSIAGHLGILDKVLKPFRSRYPEVRLRVVEGLLPALESDIRQGKVDLFVGPVPEGTNLGDLSVAPLFDNERVVVGRNDHPLSHAQSLADLAGAEWLATSVTHDTSEELRTAFTDRDLAPPRIVCQCHTALSMITVLMNSDILGMLPVQWTQTKMLEGQLTSIPIRERLAAAPIMLLHRSGLGLTPAAEYFADLVRRRAETTRMDFDSDADSISPT